jgi:hypothetical protein
MRQNPNSICANNLCQEFADTHESRAARGACPHLPPSSRLRTRMTPPFHSWIDTVETLKCQHFLKFSTVSTLSTVNGSTPAAILSQFVATRLEPDRVFLHEPPPSVAVSVREPPRSRRPVKSRRATQRPDEISPERRPRHDVAVGAPAGSEVVRGRTPRTHDLEARPLTRGPVYFLRLMSAAA